MRVLAGTISVYGAPSQVASYGALTEAALAGGRLDGRPAPEAQEQLLLGSLTLISVHVSPPSAFGPPI
jgi:hypothetical protein